MKGRITWGDFSLGKCNVTLNCFCCRPIRMLVNSMWGNSNARAWHFTCRKIL